MRQMTGRLSIVLLIALTVLGVGYLAVGVLRMDPMREPIRIEMTIPETGGLMESSRVLLRGIEVGRIVDIRTRRDHVEVTAELRPGTRVPVDSPVEIANLSAVGEQYLEFRPDSDSGPYLSGGDRIPPEQVRVSSTVSEMLTRMGTLADQVDPEQMRRIADVLGNAFGDPAVAANLREAGRLMAQTITEKRDALRRLFVNAQRLTRSMGQADIGAELGDTAPPMAYLEPQMGHLITSLGAYSRVADTTWDETIGPVVDRIAGYFDTLAPDFGFIATVLRPATQHLRSWRVDAAAITDLWRSVFPGNGRARVTIRVPAISGEETPNPPPTRGGPR